MPTIDESVVKLSLDDSQFDKASDRTISKLDELKRSLQFNGAVEGFKEIEKAAKQTDFSPMEKGVQAVSNQFNALYTIADATIRRLVNGGLDQVERTLKSLTIDNVAAGWDKYAEKTSAVQTIMASTADQFEDTGEQMDYVEGQLEKLNWFTDETSYKFLDMANNIGKFTANEVGLDDAVTAMQGISNWAAISGSGIRGASMAMYNLAQAISMGSLKLQDWRSIELANMGTSEFKRVAMEAGEAAGELIKVADGVYKTVAKGTEVTTKSFRNSLAEGWLTTDVLMNTLKQYGDFTNELFKMAEETDMSATPLIRYINEYKEGTLDLEDAMLSTGLSANRLIDYLERLGSEEYDLGRRSFAAAQEAKTFQEAVDAVKEAVGTGWSNTFEAIFGNYEEAKKLWSDFAEGLYEVFVESGNMRNGLLRDWKAIGGRTYLIEAIYNIFGKLKDAIFFFKDTFEEIFPQKTAIELKDMTEGFRDFIEALTPSENMVTAFHNALTLLLTIMQKVGQVALVVFAGLEPIYEVLMQLASAVIGLVGDISALLGINLNEIFSADALTNLYKIIYSISSAIASLLRGGLYTVIDIMATIIGLGDSIWTTFKNGEGGIKGFIEAVVINFQKLFDILSNGNGITGFINNIFTSLQRIFKFGNDGIIQLFESIKSGESVFSGLFMGIYNIASTIIGAISLLVKAIFDSFSEENVDSNPLVNFFKNVGAAIEESNILENIGSALTALLQFVSDLIGGVDGIAGAGKTLREAISWFLEEFNTLWDWFVSELTRMSFRDIVDVLLIFAIVDVVKSFGELLTALGKVPTGLSGILTSIRNAIDVFSGSNLSTLTTNMSNFVKNSKYLQMAIAITVLVNGLRELASLDTGQLGVAVAAIATVFGMLAGLMKLMEIMSKTNTNNTATTALERAANNVIKFALGVGILASAAALLGQLDLPELAKGLGGLAVVMLEIVGFVYLLKQLGGAAREIQKVSAGMIVFAAGIALLTVPMLMMTVIDIPHLIAELFVLAGLMVAFGGAAKLMEKVQVGPILAAAAAFDIMAIGLSLLSVSIAALSFLDLPGLAKGGIAVALMLAGLTAACIALSKWGSTNVKGMLAASAAMISMSVAIGLLTVSVAALSLIPLKSLGSAAAVFISALIGFAVVAAIAQAASIGLFALSVAIIAIGASFLMFATGVKTLVDAVAKFTVLVGVIMAVAETLGEDFPAFVQMAFDNFVIVVRAFLRTIPELAADIAAAAYALIIALKYGFLKAMPDILNGIMIVLILICDVIAKWGGPLINALASAIDSMADEMPVLMTAASRFVEEFVAGLGDLLFGAIMGLGRAVFGMFGFGGVAKDAVDEFRGIGRYADEGLRQGIEDGKDEVLTDAYALGADTTAAVADGAAVRSPSEETYATGGYIDQGLENGMEDGKDSVTNKGKEVGESAINGVNEGVGTEDGKPSWKTAIVADGAASGFLTQFGEYGNDFYNSGYGNMMSMFSGMMSGVQDGGNAVSSAVNAVLRGLGVGTRSVKTMESEMNQLYDEMELSGSKRKELDKEFAEYDTKKVEEAAFDFGQGLATSFDKGLSSGSKKSGGGSGKKSSSAAEKVKTAAEEIIESYESALKELDYLDKKYKGEYDLYKALNPDLNELQQNAQDWEYVNKQIEVQLKRTEIAEEKYHKIAKAMGEASQEARDAEIEWVQEQVTLAELRQDAAETQAKIIGDAAVQLELEKTNAELTYNLWEAANQNASEQEKLQQKLVYITKKLAYASNEVAEAEKNYAEAVEIYGENSEQANQAANELLQTQIDYQNTLNEHIETEKSLRETYKEDANLKLEVAKLEYDIWEARNKQATEEEKLAKRQELHEKEYQKALNDRAKAYTNFELIVRRCGASSKEAEEAYKAYLEADYEATQKHQQLIDDQVEALDLFESKYEAQQSYAEAIRELWKESNENASLEVKRAKEALDLEEDLEAAYTQLVIIDQKIANALKDHAETSEEVVALKTQYIQQQTKILQITKRQKEMDLTRLNDAKQELEYEKKRLELNERIWEANNQYATDAVKNAHELEKTQSNIVMAQKELNNLSKEYAYMVEKYGESSQEARDALYEYESKLVDILELQNSIKETYMDMIDSEAALLSAAETRAGLENELWEALNADADEATSKANKLSYQMQSLEMKTDKLRNASKKYNYALKMYGEEAAETQELYNDMLQAQIDYAKTFNEIKTLQLDTIEKNNEIIEQLQYSEKLLDYGFNMWDKLNSDISDAQKIEAEIAKLNKSIVLQVQKANYYGAEWRKAVSQYGQNSVEAQEAYLNYLEALYNALDTQSSIAEKEEELVKWREENNKKLQDAWDEIKTPDLAGGTSVYEELLEMGLSEAEIEAYVKEKAGYIEDAIGTEMDFSIETMQSKAEDALRQWGLTWVDGTFDTAATVVTNTSNCMGEMTDIIAEGAAEGEALAEEAMAEIEKTAEEGAEELVETTEEGMDDMADAIESKSDEILEAFKSVIDEMIWWGQNGANDDLVETGHSILYTIGQSMITNKWSVIDRIIDVMEEAIWWAKNQDYESIGSYLTQGIGQGITRDKWNVVDAMVTVVEDAIWAANQAAQIRSPSRVTTWTGEMLDAGVVTGIENRAGEIAKSLSSAVQNGILAMNKIIHTSNTLDFAGGLIADGIMGGIEGYSYNIMAVGKEVLNTLADEYDEYVDDLIGDNQWLIDALREYGFDESTHGIDFVINLDTTDAKTRLEQLFSAREEDLEYYDDLLDLKEKNAQKDQSDLAVRAEAQAINRELNRVANAISSYEKQISNIVSAGKAASSDDTIAAKKLEYVQNIYSTKPLSALDIYRNTNSQLLRFTAWR